MAIVYIKNTSCLLVSTFIWQIPAEGVPVNSELDVKVDFIAPQSPGRYISYWRMASSNGAKFGQRVWVLIHVLPRSLLLVSLNIRLSLSGVFNTFCFCCVVRLMLP